ncbi:hypothetical protein AVEN_164020-1, partial [Araneus ventricosus]
NLQELEKHRVDQGRLLERNTDMVTSIRNRLATGRKERFYYLTIPGIIRIIEVPSGMVLVSEPGSKPDSSKYQPCVWTWCSFSLVGCRNLEMSVPARMSSSTGQG